MSTEEFSNAEIAEFLDQLDRKYQNRAGMYSWPWSEYEKSGAGVLFPPVTYARACKDMTEYEIFVLKMTDLLEFIQFHNDGGKLLNVLRASIAYADGRSFEEYRDRHVAGVAEMLGPRSRVPPPVADTVRAIERTIANLAQAASVFPALNRWLQRHVGRSPGGATTGSVLFTDNPGPHNLPIGLSETGGDVVFYQGEASLLTIAPPGKGKTQCHVLPTLATYPGPIIALDVKGECYTATHELREKLGHHVIRFAPTEPDPDKSARYNPLAFVDDHPDELWESARFLADLMVIVRSQNEPTWEMQGKDLLTLFIAYTVHSFPQEERTIQKILDLVSTIGLAEMLEDVAKPGSPYPSAMQRTAAKFRQTSVNSPKQFEGVLAGASQHMQVWEGPKIERLTQDCDWEPEDFRREPSPTLYLCVPPEAIETYAPILRVVIGQHVRRLMRQHERKGPPILFVLDELPRLGQMQPIREALETGRSYGIKLWMFAQYPEQLTSAYPGFGEGMMESCEVRMYIAPSMGTAETISKAFGESLNVFGGVAKQVLEPAAIVSPEHRESIFVLASGEDPLILKKRYFHEYGAAGFLPAPRPAPARPAPAASAMPRTLTKPPTARRAIEATPLPLRKRPDHPSVKQAVQMYLDMEELNTRPVARAAALMPSFAKQSPTAPERYIPPRRQAAPEPRSIRLNKWWMLSIAITLLPLLGWGAMALLDEVNQRQAAELKRLTEVEKQAKIMFETQDQLNARERKLRDSTAGLELDRAQLEQQKKTLEVQRQTLSAGQRTLAAEQEAQDRQRRFLTAERDELNRQRAQLDAERRTIQAEWERLARQQAAPPPTESEWPPARRYGPPPSRYGPPGPR